MSRSERGKLVAPGWAQYIARPASWGAPPVPDVANARSSPSSGRNRLVQARFDAGVDLREFGDHTAVAARMHRIFADAPGADPACGVSAVARAPAPRPPDAAPRARRARWQATIATVSRTMPMTCEGSVLQFTSYEFPGNGDGQLRDLFMQHRHPLRQRPRQRRSAPTAGWTGTVHRPAARFASYCRCAAARPAARPRASASCQA